MVQQEAAQPPAVGECAQLNTLNVLVDSLSSLVKTLSLMIPAAVLSGTAAQKPVSVTIHNLSPLSVSHSASLLSQHSPNAIVIGGMSRELNVPTARVNVPEACMKEVMLCEMSPLGYHLSLAVKEKIWRGDFIAILSLLPSYKDFMVKMGCRGEEK